MYLPSASSSLSRCFGPATSMMARCVGSRQNSRRSAKLLLRRQFLVPFEHDVGNWLEIIEVRQFNLRVSEVRRRIDHYGAGD